ncbi:MAG: hypothetical protein JRF08_06485 [Deltaproteobacteria bacterium]|nr:hypothetical protein [Deltaproteobacteria bacterium]
MGTNLSQLGDNISSYLSTLDIKLIVNQVRTKKDRAMGQKMAIAAKKYFGIPIDFLGNAKTPHGLFATF